jgi:hypothetical protein
VPQDEAGYYRPEYRRDYEDRGPQLRLNFCRRDDRGRTEIVGGQAADQNNISRIVSWEIDNGARHGEVVQSD